MTVLQNMHPKKLGRDFVCRMLERQVVQLRQKHAFTVVAVVGSIGKTSTKMAIAKTLAPYRRTVWQTGNYNDRVTVPLVLFNQDLPGLLNVLAWCKIWRSNRRMIRGNYPYDVAVVELGTDGPGQIAEFAYLQPDVTVVTAVAPEHMEFFKTLDAVATEELSVAAFSNQLLVNSDDTSAEYLKKHLADRPYASYGLHATAVYYATKRQEHGAKGQTMQLHLAKGGHPFILQSPLLGAQGAKITVAAAATAHLLGLDDKQIQKGLQQIEAFAGRMQILSGIKKSTLIDDTYNAAPVAVKAALDVLYQTEATQRIAILGTMNELGDYAPEAHREVGAYCNPHYLDMVVTIGKDAAEYLAPIAQAKGCKVQVCDGPYQAGAFVKKHLQVGAVVLAKGSQNGVFAEEALKPLLARSSDIHKLVRQSPYWLHRKAQQFTDHDVSDT